jgi:hypothetical protein
MGFKKSWDVSDIANQINSLARECASPYNDGFTGWYLKQDLYLIKETLDHALKISPDFGDMEKLWLKEQEQKRIIKLLKD